MRTSYLGITACCAIVYIYAPAYLIMPLMIASGIGSAAVIYAHAIIIRQLDSDGFAQSASSISWRLIQALTEEDTETSTETLALQHGKQLMRQLERIPEYRTARSIIRALGPIPCLPGLFIIKYGT